MTAQPTLEKPSEALARLDKTVTAQAELVAELRAQMEYLSRAVAFLSETSLETSQVVVVEKTRAAFGNFPIPLRK